MSVTSRFYKVIVIIVNIGLIVSLMPPPVLAEMFGTHTLYTASSVNSNLTSSLYRDNSSLDFVSTLLDSLASHDLPVENSLLQNLSWHGSKPCLCTFTIE